MKNFTINISTEAVMNHIYALSALRTLGAGLSQPTEALLTREEAPALRLVIKDTFVMLVGQMACSVETFNVDDDEMLSVTLIMPKKVNATAFRHELERILAFRAMATALPCNEAEDYEATARETADELRRTLAGAGQSGRITPHWL
ncbi:MAG: hypothetical protein K2M65_02080 [Muribaculaceae bacterium]|nr:hypothetical protein [Muribaculaceae bacterium]